MDENSLMEFVHKAVGDVGAMMASSLVAVGDRLGYYREMADGQPVTAEELAHRTHTSERYVEEWLAQQAASGYLSYDGTEDGTNAGTDAGKARYVLPPEQAVVLTDETSPVYLPGLFQVSTACVQSSDRVSEAFRTGSGIGWGDHHADLYEGTERLFGASYSSFLTQEWVPALDGVEDLLKSGASVVDVGCGHGVSTRILAEAFPRSRFVGVDPHPASIDLARAQTDKAGLGDRVQFEVGTAQEFTGRFDLVALFDCLHDMGDPVGACAHVRQALTERGSVLLVEPRAGDRVEENLNPIGALYYGASTMVCVPNAIEQGGSETLGAQAGEARLREVFVEAGFAGLVKRSETPFHFVYQAAA